MSNVLIANGASLSGAVSLESRVAIGIVMPSGWDAANLTFQVSVDGGTTYNNLYDSSGNEVSYTVAASRYIPLDPSVWIGITNIKVRSGTSGSAVNQTADRNLTLVTKL